MYWRRTILSLFAIFVLLVGPSVVMVQAAYVPSAMVTHTQSFDRAENNHTYVYTEGPPNSLYNTEFLTQEEDVDSVWYGYQETTWQRNVMTYPGPAERRTTLSSFYTADWGWLDSSHMIPSFWDFSTEDPESEIGYESVYNVFPLAVNAEYSLVVDSRQVYIGTFNVTDEEFFHLTVTSHQDGCDFYWDIFDYDMRRLADGYMEDGNIEVTPFKNSGEGTYYLIFEMYSDDAAPVTVDFLIESIVPERLLFGDVVEGTLPGSEVIFDEENNNAWVIEQLRPNVHTYKFSTNSTQFGRLSVLFESLGGIVFSYDTRASITACLFEEYYYEYAFWWDLYTPSDVFYYTAFENETYYVTIQGMDNTGFTIINQMVDIPVLPMNEEFYIENWDAGYTIRPYRLSLGQDSVLRVNRTEWSSGFHWEFFTLLPDGHFESFVAGEGSTFEGATSYYVPAGDYLILARSEAAWASGLYEFNFGPVLDGAGAVAVEVDRLLGVRVPIENLMFYRTNITLMTQDNVSVNADFDFLNNYGYNEYAINVLLGNRQSGTSWEAYGTNTTSLELGLDISSYTMFCDGYAIIVVAPYRIRNNTAGITNDLFGRTVDYEITFDEDEARIIHGIDTAAIGSEFSWTNFSLTTDGDSTEYYAVRITDAAGVWMNISFLVEDIDDMWAYAYQDIDGRPQRLTWNYLDDSFMGTINDGAFEMGGISNDILLIFGLDRYLAINTTLAIGITPYDANDLTYLPIPSYYAYGSIPGPVAAGIDPALAIAGVGIVAVVVVVVVVVLKKRGSI
ncbi:MAG: hypothetical protein KAR33_00325 [Candidatus Thorarchaeota archaeon]|nr:hypothetical protein [Candidatus Thorarchaeota archaeon]